MEYRELMMDNKKIYLIFLILLGQTIYAVPGHFTITSSYQRNPKIWGTYKLLRENIVISRGKKKWNKRPPERFGDAILEGENIVLIRENKTSEATKVVVDKIPYTKKGKNSYNAESPSLNEEGAIERLFKEDLIDSIPHKDLLEGHIEYEEYKCKRNGKSLNCTLKGVLHPRAP